jgi:hypothetical protein
MAQITVNARTYELVTLDDLTLDEAMVLWDYTRMSLDQVAEIEGFHAGVTKALIHVSVARGEPGETARTIGYAVGQIKLKELNTVFSEISEEVQEVPPPSGPPPPAPGSGSGAASTPTGAPPQDSSGPNGSGSPGSATGATSDPRISVP